MNSPVYVAGFERGVRPIGLWSMSMTLSMCSKPGDARVRAGNDARAIEMARERAMQDVLDQRRLARARHARHRDEQSERDLDVEIPQVVLASRPRCGACGALPADGACDGMAIFISPRRYLPVIDAGFRMISSTVPSAITSPPCLPAPGPRSITWSAARIVSSSCSTTITVLPRSRSCSSVAQQPRVVALVQADRRLVEDVQHADQPRADLRRQPDALRLAARERLGRAAEREVVEADVDEEAQPLAHFLEDRAGDLRVEPGLAVRAEPERFEERRAPRSPEFDDLADALAAARSPRATSA